VIRLGLADDEPLHIMGLATLLGAQPDMEIIWRAGRCQSRAKAHWLHPEMGRTFSWPT